MPASTPEQQRLMGMAYSLKKGEIDPKDASQKVTDLAKNMTLKQLKDFASTKHSEMKEDFTPTYEKFINELTINHSNKFNWFVINKRSYGFDTDKHEYYVDFQERKPGSYEIEYYVETSADNDNEFIVTNENKPFKILTTIGDICQDFIKKNNVEYLEWSPSFSDSFGKENPKKSIQRNVIYSLLVKSIKPGAEIDFDGKMYKLKVSGLNEDYARVHPNPGMNIGGMGPIVIPGSGPFGVTGSGDIPAPYSSRDKKLMKSGKKKGVMPIKFAETDFQSFENLIQYEEGRQIMEELSAVLNFTKEYQIIEKSETYTRILERIMPLNEDTETYYSLSETRKNQIDEIIWNGIYEYAVSDEINEGFFSSIISSVKDAGKGAIELAKKVIENVGAFLKAAKEYIKAGLTAAMKAGADASKALSAKAKSKAEGLKNKVDLTSDMLKKDLKNLNDTINHIVISLPSQYDTDNAQQAASILKSAPKEDIASAEKSLNKAESNESIYNLLDVGIKHAILELKNSSGYLESIMEDAESAGQDIASDSEAKKKEAGKNKLEKAKGKGISFMGVIHLLMTGIVTFVEACLKAIYQMGFKALSVVISKLGGPGPFEFIAISSLLAAVTGLVLELFAEVIGEITGSKYIKLVSVALHSTNPAMLAGHAVEHSLPGAGSIIKACCISYAIYATVEHVISLGEQEEEPAKA